MTCNWRSNRISNGGDSDEETPAQHLVLCAYQRGGQYRQQDNVAAIHKPHDDDVRDKTGEVAD